MFQFHFSIYNLGQSEPRFTAILHIIRLISKQLSSIIQLSIITRVSIQEVCPGKLNILSQHMHDHDYLKNGQILN